MEDIRQKIQEMDDGINETWEGVQEVRNLNEETTRKSWKLDRKMPTSGISLQHWHPEMKTWKNDHRFATTLHGTTAENANATTSYAAER